MSVEKFPANLPLVKEDRTMTPTTEQIMAKMAAKIDELEARIVVLEP